MQTKREIYKKQGKKWIMESTTTEEGFIYKMLSNELINKKLLNGSYITKILYNNLNNGYIQIIVYYDNNFKSIYTIKH